MRGENHFSAPPLLAVDTRAQSITTWGVCGSPISSSPSRDGDIPAAVRHRLQQMVLPARPPRFPPCLEITPGQL